MSSKTQNQLDVRLAILALVLTFSGSGMLHARSEVDPCGRSYPQLTAKKCNPASPTLAVKSIETTKGIQVITSPDPVQLSGDLVRIRNNRGRE